MPVKMTFFKGGKVKIEPYGFSGSRCHEATRPYEEAFNRRGQVSTDGEALGLRESSVLQNHTQERTKIR